MASLSQKVPSLTRIDLPHHLPQDLFHCFQDTGIFTHIFQRILQESAYFMRYFSEIWFQLRFSALNIKKATAFYEWSSGFCLQSESSTNRRLFSLPFHSMFYSVLAQGIRLAWTSPRRLACPAQAATLFSLFADSFYITVRIRFFWTLKFAGNTQNSFGIFFAQKISHFLLRIFLNRNRCV